MPKQKKKSKKPQANFSELLLEGLIDLIIAVASAWIAKHLP